MNDPFVRQLTWLIATAGGKEALVKACGRRVGVRTLDTWSRGGYPRTAVTGAVRELDAWALQQDFGYPDAAAAPRLVASCGRQPVPPPARAPRWRRWSALAAAQLTVVGATVGVTLVITDHSRRPSMATPAATTDLIAGFLPSQGDGRPRPQTVAAEGVNTYADPRGLTVGGGAVPAGATVDVRCRIEAAPMPSEGLDGWWYLVDSGAWAGLWAAADGFAPGAEPGQDDGYATDLDVPVCSTSTRWAPGS
ncbi:hypothetical protein TEK04_14990 [Klenkia sp. LSe6-5]|uniref:Ig-like domain-containing protein n=1 Tax=Klenkia sesuvii TaxID=3103137 RepID=A0ABU8DYE7_9ACTN